MPRFRPQLPPRRARSNAVESLEPRRLMATGGFGNSLPIWIYDGTFGEPGVGSQYPSGVNVFGMTGALRDVRVTFYGFEHRRPADVDVMLVAPPQDDGGPQKSVLIMSDAGDSLDVAEPIDVTFASDATRDLPELDQIRGGTYRPTDYNEGDGDVFPGNVPDTERLDSLAALAGINPNGLWHLYVVDDNFLGAEGGIDFGWSVTVVTGGEGPAAPSAPDMSSGSDSGQSNTDNVTMDQTPTFSGTATAGTTVNLYSDGVLMGTAPITAGRWTVTPDTPLGDGTHSITVRALNDAGDEGAASPELNIEVDTTAPPAPGVPDLTDASDTGASNTDDVTSDNTPTFAGTAPEASRVTLFANGTTQVGTGVVDAGGNYTVTAAPALAVGTYDVVAGAVDLAGNFGPLSSPLTVRIEAGTSVAAVQQVFVNGTSLTANTTQNAAWRGASGADLTFGYPVPDGANQLRPIPWNAGVNKVSLRFTQDVASSLDQADLQVRGSGGVIPTTAYSYDAPTRTGTWTLGSTVAVDKLRFVLNAAGVTGLDGEWVNPATATPAGDTYPSGNGTAGGDFNFRVNVLRGDTNGDQQVNALDVADVKKRLLRRPGDGVTGSNAYSIFADLNTDGVINALDVAAVKGRLNTRINTLPDPATALLG
jgi:hypothetical protein